VPVSGKDFGLRIKAVPTFGTLFLISIDAKAKVIGNSSL
jgi:hypothetical protein